MLENPSLPIVLKGSCACGAITWTSTYPARHMDFCYCIPCQQISGAPFAAWIGLPKFGLTWYHHNQAFNPTDSDPGRSVYRISPLATRSCCRTCGGAMTMQYDCYPDKTHLAAGGVVEGAEDLPKVGCHIWVKRKPTWYEIPDDGDQVPKWEEFDEEFEALRREWEEKRKMESRGS